MKRSIICCIIMSAIFCTSLYSSENNNIINTETKEFPKSKDLKRGYPNSESIQAIDLDCTNTQLPAICVQDIMNFIPPASTNCGTGGLVITSGAPTILSGSDGCVGTVYFVQYNATDNCGQVAACAQDFVIVAPTVTCPDNQTGLSCNADLPVGPTTIQEFLDGGGSINGDCVTDFTISFADSPDPTTIDFCNAAGTIVTRTYTITNACNVPETFTCAQTFTFEDDTTPPTASNPATITINCSAAPAPDPEVVIDEADNCSTTIDVAFVSDVSNGSSCPEVVTRTYSLTDACGNSSTVQQIINLDDTMVPVLTCPSNLILECDGDYTAEINAWLATATATDGCSAAVTITTDYVAGSLPTITCDQSIGLTVTFNATDDCDNMAVPCTATIILDDNAAPIITCPADIEVACGGDTSSASTGVATATDACGMVMITESQTTVSACGNTETITRTWLATDACGNTDSCIQTITVVDNTDPVITCPANVIVECGEGTTSATTGVATATDACGAVSITESDSSVSTCGNTEIITRTWLATDACGNTDSCVQTITVTDTTDPIITCPPGLMGLTCNSVLPDPIAPINDFITAGGTILEACGATSISSSDSADPSTFSFCAGDGPFVVIRTYTVTDACGNTGQCTQSFAYVADTEGPTFTCGANLTVNANAGECSAMVTIAVPTPTDNCTSDAEITLVNDMNGMADASGNYPVGTSTIIWTATDNCGNTSTCTINIIVNDNEDPVITCPADVSIDCDISEAPAATTTAEFEAQGGVITDNCMDATLTISHADVSDGNTCPEIITRTYTFTQGSLSITCDQVITIDDDTAPVLSCGADFTINTDAGLCTAMATIAVPTATDNCGVSSIVNNMNGMADASGDYPLGTTAITWTATDECGNTATCLVNLTVMDNTLPTITCPDDLTEMCSIGDAPAATTISEFVTQGGSASDNCDMDLSISSMDVSDGNMCPEEITRTYTVTDDSGLTATCVQIITVDDTTLPVITCPADMTVECGGDTSVAAMGSATATDNCTAVAMIGITSSDVSVPACATTEVITRTWTATDACGNIATCNQIITVQDNIDPILTVPANLVLECDGDYAAEITAWLATASATDGCSTPSVTNDYTLGDLPTLSCDQSTGLTVIFTATDACGNTDIETATIIIDDTEDPTIICPADLVLECDGDYATEITAWLATVSASDGCSAPAVTNDYTDGDLPSLSCDLSTGITVTFTATDDCGNTSTCVSTIFIDDTVLPTISCPADLILECDGDYTTEINTWLATVSGSDTCDAMLDITNDYTTGDLPELSCDLSTGLAVTFTATDDCGNQQTCVASIFIDDTIAPTIICPADLVLECDGDYASEISAWLATATVSDLCDSSIDFSNDYTTGNLPELSCDLSTGLVVTFTAIDDCENSFSCMATIFLDDTVSPDLTTPANLVLECDGDYTAEITAWLATASATDGCSTPSVTNDYTLGDLPTLSCDQSTGLTVTFTATDDCGNTDIETATIILDDTEDPTIICPANLVLECDGDYGTEINAWLLTASAMDGCSLPTITTNYTPGSLPMVSCDASAGLEITFTATDDCGNTATCEALIIITDTVAPVITCPANVTDLTCEDELPAGATLPNDFVAFQGGTIIEDCSSVTVSFEDDLDPANLDFCPGSDLVITRTYTISDECGNSATCQQTFTYLPDTEAPVLDCSVVADITLECGDAGNDAAVVDWLTDQGQAILDAASDDCGEMTVMNNYVTGTYPTETICCNNPDMSGLLVTFTVEDECGNTATCEASILLDDNLPPELNCTKVAAPLILECNAMDQGTMISDWLTTSGAFLLSTASDQCTLASNVLTVTNDYDGTTIPDLSCDGSMGLTVNFIVTDCCGNSTSCASQIIVDDTILPTITCPDDLLLECGDDANFDSLISDWLDTAMANDACGDVTITNDYDGTTIPVFSCDLVGGVLVIFTATDDCDNEITCTASIFQSDTTDPAISCPNNLILGCDGDYETEIMNWLATASATDDCDTDVDITNDYVAGMIPPLSCDLSAGIMITFIATDDCGNTSSCTAMMSLDDNFDPDIVCPSNLILECDGDYETEINAWLATVSATDGCDASVTITNDYTAGDLPALSCDQSTGLTVTFTATDDCGNEDTCTATIIIDDTVLPVITCPTDLTLECDGDYETEINAWLALISATDVCDADLDITNDYAAGDLPDVSCDLTTGLVVTFTATDDCDNMGVCTATIFLNDTVDPMISCPADLTLECDGDYTDEINTWIALVSGSDACDTDVEITDDYDGSIPAVSCDLSSGLAVTFTATDECDNTATCVRTIFINDTMAPDLKDPAMDVTVECDGSSDPLMDFADWLANAGNSDVEDLCDDMLTITNTSTGLSNDCGITGTETVTFTFTDACDNTVSTTATFTITDNTPPEITMEAMDLKVECSDISFDDMIQEWIDDNGGAEAEDECGEVTWTTSSNGVLDDCNGTGQVEIMFIATDECGNSSTTVALFTAGDETPPMITTEAMDMTVECDGTPDPMDAFADWLADFGGAEANDICGDVTWTNNSMGLSDDCGATGTETVVFTATDDCGNSATTQAIFTIEDTTDPVWVLAPANMTVECDGTSDPSGAFTTWLSSFTGMDTCGDVVITNNSMGLSDDCGATGSETVTFTLTDDCDNFITADATFTIEDTTDPVWVLAPMDLTLECDGIDPADAFNAWLMSWTGTDICGGVVITNNSTGLSDDCGMTGTETVTFTLTDDCGNAIMDDATFTIVDTTPAVIDPMAMDMTVECDGTSDPSGAFAAWLANNGGAIATDACGMVTWSNNSTGLSDDCGATGSETVIFTATDECGNTSMTQATFTIEDTIAPLIDPMAMDMAVECDGTSDPSGAFAAWLASFGGADATDACGTYTWTNNSMGLSDDCGATGSETVIFTATDECGNTSTTQATFTIEDTTAPLIDPIAMDMTVECNGMVDPMGAFAAWLADNGGAAATDVCGSLTWSNNSIGLSDDCGITGSETVTFTATDECGNTSTTQATFTIEDTTDPVIDPVASDMTVECDGSSDPMGAFAAWLADNGGAAATDVCGAVSWGNNSTGLSDDCGATGTETVIFTATDECGNTSTTQATFTIEDTTDPTWTPPTDMTVECDGTTDPGGAFAAWLISFTGIDICGTATVTNNSMGLSDDCGATGSETVTFTLTDECGNAISADATFTIEDTTAPEITCATLLPFGTNATTCDADVVIDTPVATDACGTVSITWTATNGTMGTGNASATYPIGSTTVTYTATDECGITSTCSHDIIVIDNVGPALVCSPAQCLILDNDGQITVPATSFVVSAIDNCGVIASTQAMIVGSGNTFADNVSFDCNSKGMLMVMVEVTDDSGNTTQCTVEVTLKDNIAPSLDLSITGNNTCLPDVTINCEYPLDTMDLTPLGTIVFDAANQNDIVINGVNVGQDGIFTDNCDSGLFILSDTSDDSGVHPQCNVGDLIRTVIVSDVSGNTTACVQTITIMDEDPFTCDEVTWPADYSIMGCTMMSIDPTITGEPSFVIDKCSLVGTNYDDVEFNSPLSGCPYIERTWTLLDWCQYDPNTPGSAGICTYTQILTYVNTTPPTIISGGQDTVICANPNTCLGEVNLLLTANDDCTDSLDISYNWSINVNGEGISFINGMGNTLVGNFPQGDHILTWTVEDRCGNITTRDVSMVIRDCKAPLLVCKFGLSTTLLPKNNGCVVIWASDFVKSVEDNCTDLSDIAISFSADTTDTHKKFTCLELGDQTVEIWATDSNGNQTLCTTVIDIQDNLNVCPSAGAELMISGELRTEMGDPIALAAVTVEGSDMEDTDMSDDTGIYAFENLPSSDDYMVVPYKNDDAINGVSTIDLVLIQKHILGLAELDSPYKMIAADANNSQSISAIDLIEIRKLILGIYNEYPNNTSWRFVDQEFQFADPTDPWPFMEEVMNSDMSTDQMEVDFVGVKIGDVNNTVEASSDKEQSSKRSGKSLDLIIEDQDFKAGDIVKVDVKSKDFIDIVGLQYTLNLDATRLSYLATESAILNVTELNVGLPTVDQLTFSWNTLEGKSVADSEVLYRVSFIAHTDGTLSQSLDLNSSITSAEAYDSDLETIDLSLDLLSSDVYATLYQNNPNPFSSYTDVSFEISKSQEVELTIYGADGKKLWNTISTYPQGLNTVQINNKEIGAVSGVLYLEMKADKFIATKKMILLK